MKDREGYSVHVILVLLSPYSSYISLCLTKDINNGKIFVIFPVHVCGHRFNHFQERRSVNTQKKMWKYVYTVQRIFNGWMMVGENVTFQF
jgi:hypothetical protein